MTGLNGGIPAHWLSRHGIVRDRQAMHDRFPRRDVKSPCSCVPVLLTSTRFAYTRSKCTMSRTVVDVAASALQIRARIRDYVYQMLLISARIIEKSSTTLFQAAIFEITGSFKIRGPLPKVSAHADKGHLITVSSGNHGIDSACAAKTLSKSLTVVLPENVVCAKLDNIKAYGTDVTLYGGEPGQAEQHLAASEVFTCISPYNDPHIVAGQGMIGLRIPEQCQVVDNIFIIMGGGGLVGGIGSVMKA
jgi:threonine dehydratase